MSIEVVLQNEALTNLRNKSIITANEVAVSVGDLFYAKNVLTNEKRVLDKSAIESVINLSTLSESTTNKTLLKG
tara:strand:- start:1860 stop:2081 length:222 start_codon:yes stop_codon:yes gene_type:complete